MQMQNGINSRLDKDLEHNGLLFDDIKGQLALLMQTLGVQEGEEISTQSQPNSYGQVLESESTLTLHHEQDYPISTLRHDTTIDQTILSQELESRDDNLRVSEEIIENVNRDEEECDDLTSESEEESKIVDSKKEESEHGGEEDSEREEEFEKDHNERHHIEDPLEGTIAFDEGLKPLDVGNVQVLQDSVVLEDVSTMLEGQVIPTLKPLEPIPTMQTPLDLDTPLLEPTTFHLGNQLERGVRD